MKEKWRRLTSETIVDSPWLRVHQNSYELPNGSVIPTYYITERSDSALCVCYTGEKFVLVRQYRPGIEKWTLCHPGGRIEGDDPSPVSGGLRELLEETGYRPLEVTPLGAYAQIPAVSTGKVHLFLVQCEAVASEEPKPDATESLEVVQVTLAELENAIAGGEMDCLACVAATYRALARIQSA